MDRGALNSGVPPSVGVAIFFGGAWLCITFSAVLVNVWQHHFRWVPLVLLTGGLLLCALFALWLHSRFAWFCIRWASLIGAVYLSVILVQFLVRMLGEGPVAHPLGVLGIWVTVAVTVCFAVPLYVVFFALGRESARRYVRQPA